MKIEIPLKLPSLNEYINMCKSHYIYGNNLKKKTENEIMFYLEPMPTYNKPIKIEFTWVDINSKRDLDNVCFAKKFILDAMQKAGKIQNDNRKWIQGFTDKFEIGDTYKVILDIKPANEDINEIDYKEKYERLCKNVDHNYISLYKYKKLRDELETYKKGGRK